MDQEVADINPASEKSVEEYVPTPVMRDEFSEDALTRMLEHHSAKLPSHFFLFSALAAMAGSLAFEWAGNSRMSRFVGMWPPALLAMGIYNKLVKVLGNR